MREGRRCTLRSRDRNAQTRPQCRLASPRSAEPAACTSLKTRWTQGWRLEDAPTDAPVLAKVISNVRSQISQSACIGGLKLSRSVEIDHYCENSRNKMTVITRAEGKYSYKVSGHMTGGK